MLKTELVTQRINKLIKERLHWDIDISNVNVFFMDVENSYYNGEFIVINSKLSDIERELDMVHEYMHYIQDKGYTLSYDGEKSNEENECARNYEIDARLFTLLYVIDQFGMYGFDHFKKITIEGTNWFNNNIQKAIGKIKDKELKELMIKELDEKNIA